MKKALKFLSLAMMILFTGALLTACVPSNVEKAKEKMEEADYLVIDYTKADDAEGCVGGLLATKTTNLLDVEGLIAILFDSKDNAKDYYESLTDKDTEYGNFLQDGKWVYAGTDGAIEVFKG